MSYLPYYLPLNSSDEHTQKEQKKALGWTSFTATKTQNCSVKIFWSFKLTQQLLHSMITVLAVHKMRPKYTREAWRFTKYIPKGEEFSLPQQLVAWHFLISQPDLANLLISTQWTYEIVIYLKPAFLSYVLLQLHKTYYTHKIYTTIKNINAGDKNVFLRFCLSQI